MSSHSNSLGSLYGDEGLGLGLELELELGLGLRQLELWSVLHRGL